MIGPWRSDEFVTGWGDLGVWCVGVDGPLVVGSTVMGLCRLFCFDSDWNCRGDCERESREEVKRQKESDYKKKLMLKF